MLIGAKEKITKDYDVVVIGAGIGGMTCANKLAKDGHRVLLLESHNKMGGLATWFKRADGDHIFDISLHGFPGGMIKTCRKYWNKDIADSIEKIHKVRIVNPQFDVETSFDKEDYTNILVEKFNLKRETVIAFFTELDEMNFYDDNKMTNGELFQKYFPDRNDVVRFLLEPITYANGSNLEDPAISYGIVFGNFMKNGVYIYKGGTDVLIGKMRDEMIKNGVDIKLHALVEKIIIEDQKVVGVQFKDQVVKTRSVVSNANLYNTIFKMAGEQYFSPEFVKKAKAVRLNSSSCQVYMGIKKGETIPFVGDLIFYSEDKEFNTELVLSPKVGSQTFSLYYPDMRPHLDNRFAIVSSSNARYEDWVNLTPEEYKNRKEYLIEKALECVDKVIPGTRAKIDFVEAATPLTIESYTHHAKGASFGTKFEGLEISFDLHKQVHGLFHAGSVGIIMSGWLGTANYGVMKSHEVMQYLSSTETKTEVQNSI